MSTVRITRELDPDMEFTFGQPAARNSNMAINLIAPQRSLEQFGVIPQHLIREIPRTVTESSVSPSPSLSKRQ